MRLFLKIRDAQDLDEDAQKAFIEKYADKYCHFEKCGVNFVEYVTHTITRDESFMQNFVIGSYYVKASANFTQIEAKIRLYNLHDHFIIFMVF